MDNRRIEKLAKNLVAKSWMLEAYEGNDGSWTGKLKDDRGRTVKTLKSRSRKQMEKQATKFIPEEVSSLETLFFIYSMPGDPVEGSIIFSSRGQMAKLVASKKVPTLGDAMKGFKKSWQNYGDINYIEYGGTQVRYDGRGGFELYDLTTPDSGYPGFILSYGAVDADELFVGRVNLSTPISELEPTSYANSVARFVGAKWYDGEMDAEDLGEYVFNVILGVRGYGGYMEDEQTWTFDDFELDEDTFDFPDTREEERAAKRMMKSITQDLKSRGLKL